MQPYIFIRIPLMGIAGVNGIALVSAPWLFSFEAPILSLFGYLLLLLEAVIFLRQFHKLRLPRNGNIEVGFGTERVKLHAPVRLGKHWGYGYSGTPLQAPATNEGKSGYKQVVIQGERLLLLLEDELGEQLILYRTLLPWQSTPKGWTYKHELPPGIPAYPCLGLKSIVRKLEEADARRLPGTRGSKNRNRPLRKPSVPPEDICFESSLVDGSLYRRLKHVRYTFYFLIILLVPFVYVAGGMRAKPSMAERLGWDPGFIIFLLAAVGISALLLYAYSTRYRILGTFTITSKGIEIEGRRITGNYPFTEIQNLLIERGATYHYADNRDNYLHEADNWISFRH